MTKVNLIGKLSARARLYCTQWTFTWYDHHEQQKTLTLQDNLSEHQAKAQLGLQGWKLAYRDGDSWWFNKEEEDRCVS